MADSSINKSIVHALCLSLAQTKVDEAQQVVRSLKDDLLSETKSSVGDKFETGRAMLQQEQKKADEQLYNAKELLATLQAINADSTLPVINTGSLVTTDQGNYYIAAAMGKLIVDDKPVYVISLASPLGQVLKGKKAGDSISLNGRAIQIKDVN
jgi:transcription elongation GreA/GreB family factor